MRGSFRRDMSPGKSPGSCLFSRQFWAGVIEKAAQPNTKAEPLPPALFSLVEVAEGLRTGQGSDQEERPVLTMSPGSRDSMHLREGDTVAVVGGGIAALAFCRHFLSLASTYGPRVRVCLIGKPGCNRCGGLLTRSAAELIEATFGVGLGRDLVRSEITECIYVTSSGGVGISLKEPVYTVLRNDKFGVPGLDSYLRTLIVNGIPGASCLFQLVWPAEATGVWRCSSGFTVQYRPEPWETTPAGPPLTVKAQVLVVATGLESLSSAFIKQFSSLTGYRPPGLMKASVCEMLMPSTSASSVDARVFLIDGILPNTTITAISKGNAWFTLTSLNRILTRDNLRSLFSHPVLREYIDLSDPVDSLRCSKVCPAAAWQSPARNFYGEGWVVLGDLAGHGKIFKDGFSSVICGARLAAKAMVCYGCSRKNFRWHYHLPLLRYHPDNAVGRTLFSLNSRFQKVPLFSKSLCMAAESEHRHGPYRGLVQEGLRSLATGERSYLQIASLLGWGLANYSLASSWQSLRRAFSQKQ